MHAFKILPWERRESRKELIETVQTGSVDAHNRTRAMPNRADVTRKATDLTCLLRLKRGLGYYIIAIV